MNNEEIVKSIKELCKKHGVTANQLENKAGLSQGLISRWLKTTPSLDKIIDIADYFNVTIDEVVGRNIYTDDAFLKALIQRTDNKQLKWIIFDKETSEKIKKPYCDYDYDDEDYYDYYEEEHLTDYSYYTSYNGGFISIACVCNYDNTLCPVKSTLCIQPSEDAGLVYQNYNTDELTALWISVIKNTNSKVPDDVLAEDFKQSFISDMFDDTKDMLDDLIEEE